jgi:LacI family transcriptional regulator
VEVEMPATLRDVARLAGVSPSTVSRALSMPGVVNATTRARVQAAAERLGYEPNRAARGLITGRTGNIGLVVPDLANPFFPSVVKGVQARARASDVAVFLADTDEDAAAEVGLVRALAKQVDGLILCSPRASQEDLAAVAQETNVVLVNRLVEGVPAVTFDTRAACGRRSRTWSRWVIAGSPGSVDRRPPGPAPTASSACTPPPTTMAWS